MPYVSVDSPGDQDNVGGDTVSNLQITASDLGNAGLTLSASRLPPGLSIGLTSGVISGTIDATAVSADPYAVTVTVPPGQCLATIRSRETTKLRGFILSWCLQATAARPGRPRTLAGRPRL